MKKYIFKRIKPTELDWSLIESAADSTVFHSKGWNDYIIRIGYRPFVVEVHFENHLIGHFVGQKIWLGVKIVAAAYDGLNTFSQGLVTRFPISNDERIVIYYYLYKWLLENNIASYLQIDDWQLREDSSVWINQNDYENQLVIANLLKKACLGDDFSFKIRETLHVDLRLSEEELWSNLHYKSCKYCVNKAKKNGLTINIIKKNDDIDGFVDVHYDQLCDVFKRKGFRKPLVAQGKKRMHAICQSLFPDRVLMIQVLGKDDTGEQQIMSSGIFCMDKGESCYFTGASYQRFQKYCPNELMVWEAMRILHNHGAGDLNFLGPAQYKLKFGTIYGYMPRLIFTRHKWIYKSKAKIKKCLKIMRGSLK